MTLARTHTIALLGLAGHPVDVEVDIADGLPSYTLLGLPDAALSESRERVRSALVNSGAPWPNRKVTVSLSPAWLPKSGSSYDLPIAVALLMAQGVVSLEESSARIYLGELGLDGQVRGVRGVLPALLSAKKSGVREAVVSHLNFQEASAVEGIQVIPVVNLADLITFLRTGEVQQLSINIEENEQSTFDLCDVSGQSGAKNSLEIAAIGGHHLFFIGPPGTGKTMLAERIPSILPVLSEEQSLEVAAITSISGQWSLQGAISRTPPFVAPHHSTTAVAMIGEAHTK